MNSYQTLSAYYDRFTDDVGYGQWADFFEQLFAREDIRPQLVLDLACGTGSLTRLLAKRGYDMIGADASPEMLMQAMQNTMDCSPRPLLINQRMEELDLYGNVDACLCCLDSVNYVTDPDDTDAAVDELEAALDGIFNDKDNTYTIINMESMTDAMNLMTSMMMSLLVGIASIALVVGGIGIMNMMLVTVTERTTEIGLRKALGAEPGQIQMQFLIEAIILSLLGGVIGVAVGLGVSFAICVNTDITFSLNTFAIGLGVGFSAAVGIIFGWAPARKASRLNPIDALRSM